VDLTVASERPSTFEPLRPSDLVTIDFTRPDLAARQAAQFAAQHPVHGVAGVDDDTVVAGAAIATALGLSGNPVHAAESARDKHQQRCVLRWAKVPVPRFSLHAIDEDAAMLGNRVVYPCVIKPLRLAASRGVIRADSPAAFVTAHARLAAILGSADAARCGEPAKHFLIEQYIPGPEVALEGLLRQGRLIPLALFDKPNPLDGPFFEETIYVTPSRLPERWQDELIRCAADAAAALGLVEGSIHAELRWHDGPWLIELAARPIGGRCSAVLRFDDGGAPASLEELVISHALGLPLPATRLEPGAAGVMMIPVPGAGELREVRGIEQAKAVPLVEDVLITAHPGEMLVPWPEGSRYPGFIYARGTTPVEVETALRGAHRCLQFVLNS
jgi:biotin carboxylase